MCVFFFCSVGCCLRFAEEERKENVFVWITVGPIGRTFASLLGDGFAPEIDIHGTSEGTFI